MQGKIQRAADLAFCLLTASPRLQQLQLVSNYETPSLPLSPRQENNSTQSRPSRKPWRSAGSGCLKLVQMGRLTIFMGLWVAALQIGTSVILRDAEDGHNLPSHGSEAEYQCPDRWLSQRGD